MVPKVTANNMTRSVFNMVSSHKCGMRISECRSKSLLFRIPHSPLRILLLSPVIPQDDSQRFKLFLYPRARQRRQFVFVTVVRHPLPQLLIGVAAGVKIDLGRSIPKPVQCPEEIVLRHPAGIEEPLHLGRVADPPSGRVRGGSGPPVSRR